MNKINIILICVVITLFSGIIGFVIGLNVNGNVINNNKMAGTYKTNDWNGKEAVLILQKDKSMIHPLGYNGTWLMEDGKLYIEFDYFDSIAQSADEMVSEFSGENKQKTEKDYMRHEKQEVTIVESGLMLVGHFFEKINK